jgi:hypothetical protein
MTSRKTMAIEQDTNSRLLHQGSAVSQGKREAAEAVQIYTDAYL